MRVLSIYKFIKSTAQRFCSKTAISESVIKNVKCSTAPKQLKPVLSKDTVSFQFNEAKKFENITSLADNQITIPSFTNINDYPYTINMDKISYYNFRAPVSTSKNSVVPKNQIGVKISPSEQIEIDNFIKKQYLREAGTKKIKVQGIEAEFTIYNGGPKGSNPAYWARNNQTGELMYIKHSADGQLQSEYTAASLYNLAGIATPRIAMGKIDDAGTCLVSKFESNLSKISSENISEIESGFAADAWLANWDSLLNGNSMIKSGKIVKIDCGGSLLYRARGGIKADFGDTVDEITTLVKFNPFMYGNMSQTSLVNSFKRVTSISDEAISELVSDPVLRATLINRRNYMSRILEKITITPKNKGESTLNYISRIRELI